MNEIIKKKKKCYKYYIVVGCTCMEEIQV